MKSINKLLAFSALLPAVSVCAFEEQESDYVSDYAFDEVASSESGIFSFSIKGFYGLALEDNPLEDIGSVNADRADLYGIVADFTWSIPNEENIVVPELCLSIGAGYGLSEIDGGWYYYDGEVDIYSVNALLGLNLRINAGEYVSFYFGPRIGINYLRLHVEWGYAEDNEDDIGSIYGGEAGINFNFTPNASLTLGVSYLASEAKPYSDVNEQSWVMFSVGYRHNF